MLNKIGSETFPHLHCLRKKLGALLLFSNNIYFVKNKRYLNSVEIGFGKIKKNIENQRKLKKSWFLLMIWIPPFFPPQILIFWLVKTPCNISEPYDNPFWEKSNPSRRRERKRENKTPWLVDTLFRDSARKPLVSMLIYFILQHFGIIIR